MDDARILAEYADRQRERGLSDDTVRHYRVVCGSFARWLGERGLTLTTATDRDVRGWVNDANRSMVTRSIYLKRLDVLYRWMRDEELRADIPTAKIPRPKTPAGVPRPLPTADLHRALELAAPTVRLMLTLAAYAGLRRAEIASLAVEDILSDPEPQLRIRGKGGKIGFIPIGPDVAAALERYGPPKTGPLFPGRKGAISRHTVGLLLSGHLRACGINATGHQARHWWGTEIYASSGCDILVTQQMLRHSNLASTQIYAQFSRPKAVEAIGNLPSAPEPSEDGLLSRPDEAA